MFLAQIVVSCSEKRAREGAVREPRAMVIVPCLPMGGHLFFDPFFGALVSLKILIFDEKCLQNGPKMRSVGSIFLEKV